MPALALIGKTSSTPSSSAAAASTAASSALLSRSTLLTAQTTGVSALAASSALEMKRSPGPTPSSRVDHEQHDVGVGDLALDAALHALGEGVAGALHAGQVGEHELPARVGVGGDAADRAAGGLGALGDDRDVRADDRVDERRLAGVRPAGEADEAGPCCAHAWPLQLAITCSCRASISPSSVSWS